MAKKEVLAKLGKDINKDGTVTFYAPGLNDYSFILDVLDENGKPTYRTDADGNNKVKVRQEFKFQRIPQRDPMTGKTSTTEKLCAFHVRQDDPLAEQKIAYLSKRSIDPASEIVTEDEFVRSRNPDAYRMAEKLAEADVQKSILQAQVDELKAKLEKFSKKD